MAATNSAITEEQSCTSAARRLTLWCLTAMSVLFASTVAVSQTPLQQSFDIEVPWQPIPVAIDGKKVLQYELHLTNFSASALLIERIIVVDSRGAVLSDLQESELKGLLGRFDQTVGTTDKLLIPPGVRTIAYLSVPLGASDTSPIELTHRIAYQVSGKLDRALVQGGAFTVSAKPPVSIGPPLRGGPWVAIYNTSWERGHRRVAYAVSGSVHIPGRFAIDWIKVDQNGKHFSNDGSWVKDWYGYGAEVLAVADSVVAATRDDVPESATLVPAKVKLEDATGNYVALNLGNGHYAFYEHLKPGSIRVKPNDHIRRGSVIGLLGYTGESTGPHLHFHISDNNSPLNAEGLPYQFERFTIIGSYPSIEAFGKSQPWSQLPAGHQPQRRREFPAPFDVVNFRD